MRCTPNSFIKSVFNNKIGSIIANIYHKTVKKLYYFLTSEKAYDTLQSTVSLIQTSTCLCHNYRQIINTTSTVP